MRFVRSLLVNTVLVFACAILIQVAGVPVAHGITWGADQVTTVAQQVELPGWMDAGPVEQITKPIQMVVDQTVAWVVRLGGK